MLDKILQLTKKFISIRSTSDNPKALEEILELSLSYLKGLTIERFEKNGVKSALIYNSEIRSKKFKIILNGHLDVIPAKENQFVPKITGNKLYGAGSMDMKANVACLIIAFKELADNVDYPLGLQLVSDEEVGGFDGTKYQIEQGVRADFVIAGEPTNFDIINKAKGVLWLKISAQGTSAHGAYPWRGENAVWKMNEFLNALKTKYPTPKQEEWITTVNLSRIETSNQAFNKIPDDCTVFLDIRYVPEEASIVIDEIKQLLPKEFVLDVVEQEPALLTDENNYIKKLAAVAGQIMGKKIISRGANGTSDVRHFARVNCPGVEFGAIGEGIGSDDEWVLIPSLETYYQILVKYLASPDGL